MNLDDFNALYIKLVEEIQSECTSSQLYVMSLLPVNQNLFGNLLCSNSKISEVNNLIRSIADKHKAQYIDIHSLYEKDDMLNEEYSSDGVHLKADAYSLWYEALRNYIE